LINYSGGILPLVSDGQEKPRSIFDVTKKKIISMKIENHKENSGQPKCLSHCTEAVNDHPKPHAGNGKGVKKPVMLARGQDWIRSGRGRLKKETNIVHSRANQKIKYYINCNIWNPEQARFVYTM